MPKLTDNTVVNDPETGLPTALLKGEDVPVWAVDQVGDHLVEQDDDGEDDGPDYAGQSNTDLEKEIGRRNTDRTGDAVIVPAGTGNAGRVVKADLVAALEADDAKTAQVEAESGSGGSGGDATGQPE